MATDNKKALVYSIIEFLEKSCKDGSVKEDNVEGIEVAIQCLGDAFDVDPTDPDQQSKYSTKPATLQNIFDVYLKTKSGKKAPAAAPAAAPSGSASASTPSEPSIAKKRNLALSLTRPAFTFCLIAVVDEEDKQKAEDLKVQGNRKMAEQNYPEAIRLYSEAISHNPNNAVFYGNRAAAYSQQGSHDQAVEDSKTAVELDPKYSKAYSRMGHAYFSLAKYQEAIGAYEKGLELDPNNATLKSSIEAARNKINNSGLERSTSPPAGGRGGGFPGGVGGMPDLGSLLNNPAMMNMAQQMMQSGAFNDLMQNPEMMANMAQQFMGGGNGGGLADMMRDPEMMNRARQFMGSMGGSGGANNNNNNEQNDEQ
ncbi:hypothetical protein INT43_002893 [Umbelopsis isabellina]|uniref:SGTA homodimerisation domain-containing protein n=1 Tax=Mortierella isabellina TaxID=91625 RepID=A0A8H7PDB2_MORIS|nr:hypothetical protein INT43_002893 [Umbelopsis isabellina]